MSYKNFNQINLKNWIKKLKKKEIFEEKKISMNIIMNTMNEWCT